MEWCLRLFCLTGMFVMALEIPPICLFTFQKVRLCHEYSWWLFFFLEPLVDWRENAVLE
jgi:hypothetical protein